MHLNWRHVEADTIKLVVCTVFYLCLVSRSEHANYDEQYSSHKVSSVVEDILPYRYIYGCSAQCVKFCEAIIAVGTTSSDHYIDSQSESKVLPGLDKPNIKNGKGTELDFFTEATRNYENNNNMTTSMSSNMQADNSSYITKLRTAKCNGFSCVLYLYCFENRLSNTRCFDIRVKHSVENTDFREGLSDYGRFLKTNQTNWQKEYVTNYHLLTGSNLGGNISHKSSWTQQLKSHESYSTKSSHFLVLYCSPMHTATLIQCFDIKMTREKRIGKQIMMHLQKEATVSTNYHKELRETYQKPEPLGFCSRALHRYNSSTIVYSSVHCSLLINESQTYLSSTSSSGCLQEGGSGCLEILLYLIFTISCLGNAVFIISLRKSRKETAFVAQDWDKIHDETRRKLEQALQYRKKAEERQRQRREEMALESERRGHEAILNFIRSLAFPLVEETRNFNEWMQSPD